MQQWDGYSPIIAGPPAEEDEVGVGQVRFAQRFSSTPYRGVAPSPYPRFAQLPSGRAILPALATLYSGRWRWSFKYESSALPAPFLIGGAFSSMTLPDLNSAATQLLADWLNTTKQQNNLGGYSSVTLEAVDNSGAVIVSKTYPKAVLDYFDNYGVAPGVAGPPGVGTVGQSRVPLPRSPFEVIPGSGPTEIPPVERLVGPVPAYVAAGSLAGPGSVGQDRIPLPRSPFEVIPGSGPTEIPPVSRIPGGLVGPVAAYIPAGSLSGPGDVGQTRVPLPRAPFEVIPGAGPTEIPPIQRIPGGLVGPVPAYIPESTAMALNGRVRPPFVPPSIIPRSPFEVQPGFGPTMVPPSIFPR